MYTAVLCTGRYFHCDSSWSAPSRVRAPQMKWPPPGIALRQLTPSRLSSPISSSESRTDRSATPSRVAAIPAGAFHTPWVATVLAITPATAPEGAKVATRSSRAGSGWRRRGKYTAAWLLTGNPAADTPSTALATLVHAEGGSMIIMALRVPAYSMVSVITCSSTSPLGVYGGTTIRLTRPTWSSA